MEVHHHSHTARKKWTHYFWEFLMLFLAVFCGFLAENQREHYVEHLREKQFMKTLLADLRNDTANFARSINTFQSNVNRFDSLKKGIRNPEGEKSLLDLYKVATIAQQFSTFNYSDRTIEQLRSAGNFRLIQKTIVSDSLIEYDRYIRHLYLALEGILEKQSLKLTDLQSEVFDYDNYNFLMTINWQSRMPITIDSLPFPLPSPNREKIVQYYNSLGMYRNWCQRMAMHSGHAKRNAIRLMELVKKEYHLK